MEHLQIPTADVIHYLRYLNHCDDFLVAGGRIPFTFNPDVKKKLTKNFLNVSAPACLTSFEKRLESNGTGFLVGTALTAADIFFAVVLDHHSQIIDTSLVSEFPQCQKLYNLVKENPAIAKYQREHPVKGPYRLMQDAQQQKAHL